ncbi:universal stress protein [Thioclava sp. SK-1]|uniref:universal stress protein n=1 Tax=Thioclava sp. SK-1 TaxID=1889770 RepID=UPI000826E9BD|nr:universal stress protein [Thioclava sp. SK-1]OCX65310.1 universal stress protein [Thioclava sp. SK-1]
MTKEIFVVAYEGDADGEKVLDYALARAKRADAELLLVHILEWSPYKFLTQEEVAERSKRRRQEMAVAETKLMSPALAKCAAAGVTTKGEIRYGQVVDLIVKIAGEAKATQIFVGRTGSHSVAARIFGSVPLGLAQLSPIPTVIVP